MRAETRVTGRRVVQYLIDAFLVGLIPSLVSIPFDRSNSTFIHILGGIIAFVVFVFIGFMYWVFFTHRQEGQTLGMKLLGLRVISKGGGPANMAQLTHPLGLPDPGCHPLHLAVHRPGRLHRDPVLA